MELTINVDIEQAIQAALSPEKIGPAVQKAVDGCVNDALREVFGYGGDVRKALIEQFAALLPHGLSNADASRFQLVLQNTLHDTVLGEQSAALKLAVENSIKGLLQTPAPELKVSELLALYQNDLYSDEKSFWAEVEESDYATYIALDRTRPSSGGRHAARTQLTIGRDGRVYSVAHAGHAFTPNALPKCVISQLDSAILAMYVGRTKLVMDLTPMQIEDFAREGRCYGE